MPDMTEILTAHVPAALTENTTDSTDALTCMCGWDGPMTPDSYATDYAAHVAAALETAGYGMVVGEVEWGVQYVSGMGAYKYDSYEEAVAVALRGVGTSVVSRTVTAWKKEA